MILWISPTHMTQTGSLLLSRGHLVMVQSVTLQGQPDQYKCSRNMYAHLPTCQFVIYLSKVHEMQCLYAWLLWYKKHCSGKRWFEHVPAYTLYVYVHKEEEWRKMRQCSLQKRESIFYGDGILTLYRDHCQSMCIYHLWLNHMIWWMVCINKFVALVTMYM